MSSLEEKVQKIAEFLGNQFPPNEFKDKYISLYSSALLSVLEKHLTEEEIFKYSMACEFFLSLDQEKLQTMQKEVSSFVIKELEKEFL
jgi:hypothetical protein